MADKYVSPEKQLLKIIENQENKKTGFSPLAGGKRFFSFGLLKGKFSFFKTRFKETGKIKRPQLDLKKINLLLRVIIFMFAVYLGVSLKIEFSKLHKEQLIPQPKVSSEVQAEPLEVTSLLKPEPYYLEKINERNIFRIEDESSKETVVFKPEPERESKLKQITANMKLVGISWSDTPDAIIEDEKAKKTYFVKPGHMIEDIKVQAVLKDRVILRYQQEEVELK